MCGTWLLWLLAALAVLLAAWVLAAVRLAARADEQAGRGDVEA